MSRVEESIAMPKRQPPVESAAARRVVLGVAVVDIAAAYAAPFYVIGYWPVVPVTVLLVLLLFALNISGYTPSSSGRRHFLMRFAVLWAVLAALAGTVGHGAGWLVVSCAGILAAALTYVYAYSD